MEKSKYFLKTQPFLIIYFDISQIQNTFDKEMFNICNLWQPLKIPWKYPFRTLEDPLENIPWRSLFDPLKIPFWTLENKNKRQDTRHTHYTTHTLYDTWQTQRGHIGESQRTYQEICTWHTLYTTYLGNDPGHTTPSRCPTPHQRDQTRLRTPKTWSQLPYPCHPWLPWGLPWGLWLPSPSPLEG